MVVEDPQSSRVLAMQGGFDARLGSFNRATQAERQPGSTIKPFVYATALDNGMTPASMIVDGFCVYQGAALGRSASATSATRARRQSHDALGPRTVAQPDDRPRRQRHRHGQGRAHDQAVGIGDYQPYLSMALGAGETTVIRMVNAYAALADHGRQRDQR
jgi:penicillin-binding protein 1A